MHKPGIKMMQDVKSSTGSRYDSIPKQNIRHQKFAADMSPKNTLPQNVANIRLRDNLSRPHSGIGSKKTPTVGPSEDYI